LVDVVEESEGEILRDATGADVGGVQTGARDTLVEFLLNVSGQFTRFRLYIDAPLASHVPRNPTRRASEHQHP
jgi:hypothetical protein